MNRRRKQKKSAIIAWVDMVDEHRQQRASIIPKRPANSQEQTHSSGETIVPRIGERTHLLWEYENGLTSSVSGLMSLHSYIDTVIDKFSRKLEYP